MLNNKELLDRIMTDGIDNTVNSINSEEIENDVIKIIVRTIQHSKEVLVTALEKTV